MEISEDSREITTFITKKGLFRYTRLMFGIVCAPEVFQEIIERVLSGCENCFNFMDDVIIFGETKEQLERCVKTVLDRFKEYNILLNHEKCIFSVEEIQFLGHVLSGKGISPANSKVVAIKQFRQPNSSEELRSFLGLVNFVGKFIPDFNSH